MIPGITPAIITRSAASGLLFEEDWSGLPLGDVKSLLPARGYSVGAYQTKVVTDLGSPTGRQLEIYGQYNNHGYNIVPTSIASILATGDWSVLDVIALVRFNSSSKYNTFGYVTNNAWNGHAFGLQLMGTNRLATLKTTERVDSVGVEILTDIPDGDLCWIRMQFYDGDMIRGKAWLGDKTDEPGAWGSTRQYTASWDVSMPALQFAVNVGGPMRLIGYSAGIDREAEVSWA